MMPDFLLELYVPRDDPDLAADDGRSVREAAEVLTAQGTPVRYRRSIFVPAEETCFVLLESASMDIAIAAARLAGVSCERVSPAFSHPTHFPQEESA